MSIQNVSFVLKLKGWIEGTDGNELWSCLSFVVMQEGLEINGWLWEMIEWLRCFPYTLYILRFCLVSLPERGERTKFKIHQP